MLCAKSAPAPPPPPPPPPPPTPPHPTPHTHTFHPPTHPPTPPRAQGYYDEDGFLFITGRIKEQINCGGEKVSVPCM